MNPFLLSGAVVVLLGLVSPVAAQTPSNHIRVRALGPHVNEDVIRYVATNAAPFHLTQGEVEANPKFTAREVILQHCGWVTDAHFGEFLKANKLNAFTLDEPLGERALALEWPACLYVRSPAYPAKVRRNETASHVYVRMTGGGGAEHAIRKFFKASVDKGIDLKRIQADTVLNGAYVTRPVALDLPDIDADRFWEGIQKLASAGGAVDEMIIRIMGTDTGSIVVATDDTANCEPMVGPPFDADAVERTYRFTAKGKDTQRARIVIIDNGFSGANPASAGSEFDGSPFPRSYFVEEKGSLVARRLPMPGGGDVYAINALNPASTPSLESGHGTHVVGLVLGGPSFRAHRAKLRGDSELPFAEITILNVGLGQRTLIRNAHKLLTPELGGEPGLIVNMSITYDQSAYESVSPTFNELFDSRPHLYVTAAGNEHIEVASNVYPAGAGGLRLKNVITVAALENSGRFAPFSNRGADTVDIAAPGCEIPSWVQNNDEETTLSGTSQAAPLVTFAAALLRTFTGNYNVRYLKSRLIAAGDLLHKDDQGYTAYRVSLNIPKALHWFDDYIRLKGRDAGEYLGDVRKLTGLRCTKRGTPVQAYDTWAFKRGADNKSWVYLGKPSSLLQPCEVAEDQAARLMFTPRYRITSNGFEKLPESEMSVPLEEVLEVVYRMPPPG